MGGYLSKNKNYERLDNYATSYASYDINEIEMNAKFNEQMIIIKQNLQSCLNDINIEMFRDGYSYIIDNFSCNEKINEEIFFHLINESYMGKGSILILSRYQKNNFKFKLQDLNSRLKSIMSAEIYPPGDQEIYSLLIKEMSDRKLNINDQHCYYILKRIKRDYKSVIRLCEIIDNYLLENKTKLTLSNLKIIF